MSNFYQVCHRYSDLIRFFIELQLEAALADGALNSDEKRVLLLICHKLNFSQQEFESLWTRQWASQSFHDWFSAQFDPNARAHEYYTNNRRTNNYNHSYNQNQQKQSYTASQSTIENAYGVLGITPTASVAEIKKAYRRLMSQHHPDKLASRGLPEGMVKMAKEKTQQITAAYELIREAKGFR